MDSVPKTSCLASLLRPSSKSENSYPALQGSDHYLQYSRSSTAVIRKLTWCNSLHTSAMIYKRNRDAFPPLKQCVFLLLRRSRWFVRGRCCQKGFLSERITVDCRLLATFVPPCRRPMHHGSNTRVCTNVALGRLVRELFCVF